MRGVVERFEGHAAGHGAVADDGDDIAVFVEEIARHSEAVCCRDRGAGVACAEIVVDALAALWKTGHAAVLSECVETVVAPGEQLMHIGLMADVPDELVLWKIVHIMQRQRDLDDAEVWREMAAVLAQTSISRARISLARARSWSMVIFFISLDWMSSNILLFPPSRNVA